VSTDDAMLSFSVIRGFMGQSHGFHLLDIMKYGVTTLAIRNRW
jgi:hypothetical protein